MQVALLQEWGDWKICDRQISALKMCFDESSICRIWQKQGSPVPLFFCTEYEKSISIWNVGNYLPDYTESSTQPTPILGRLFLRGGGVKQQVYKADYSFPSSIEVKNKWIYTSTLPIRLHGVVTHRNVTFFFFYLLLFISSSLILHFTYCLSVLLKCWQIERFTNFRLS